MTEALTVEPVLPTGHLPIHTLTERQRAIFDYILACQIVSGMAPTIREIGDRFGIRSPNGVMCHLKAMLQKGVLRERKGVKSRSYAVDAAWLPVSVADLAAVLKRLRESTDGRSRQFLALAEAAGADGADAVGQYLAR